MHFCQKSNGLNGQHFFRSRFFCSLLFSLPTFSAPYFFRSLLFSLPTFCAPNFFRSHIPTPKTNTKSTTNLRNHRQATGERDETATKPTPGAGRRNRRPPYLYIQATAIRLSNEGSPLHHRSSFFPRCSRVPLTQPCAINPTFLPKHQPLWNNPFFPRVRSVAWGFRKGRRASRFVWRFAFFGGRSQRGNHATGGRAALGVVIKRFRCAEMLLYGASLSPPHRGGNPKRVTHIPKSTPTGRPSTILTCSSVRHRG